MQCTDVPNNVLYDKLYTTPHVDYRMCRHENATQPDVEVSRKESGRNGTAMVWL